MPYVLLPPQIWCQRSFLAVVLEQDRTLGLGFPLIAAPPRPPLRCSCNELIERDPKSRGSAARAAHPTASSQRDEPAARFAKPPPRISAARFVFLTDDEALPSF